MICRRLTDKGLTAFRDYIQRLSENPSSPPPIHLLTDATTSEPIDFAVELVPKDFNSRFELGEYLVHRFAECELQPYWRDEGFWTWLALYFFDQLCPADGNGNRKPVKHYNYILSLNFKHRARHAVRTSFMLVRKFSDDARFLLCSPPSVRGELTEQLASRQFFIECDGIVRAASKLYYDPTEEWFKRGSASGKRKGNIRRYMAYLWQLHLTYDLYTIGTQDLIEMLPDEFQSFKSAG